MLRREASPVAYLRDRREQGGERGCKRQTCLKHPGPRVRSGMGSGRGCARAACPVAARGLLLRCPRPACACCQPFPPSLAQLQRAHFVRWLCLLSLRPYIVLPFYRPLAPFARAPRRLCIAPFRWRGRRQRLPRSGYSGVSVAILAQDPLRCAERPARTSSCSSASSSFVAPCHWVPVFDGISGSQQQRTSDRSSQGSEATH